MTNVPNLLVTPVASPRESQQDVNCARKWFWCFNPMANKRQAALEAQVKDLNSKLEEAMKSHTSLKEELLDAVTRQDDLEQEMEKVRSENDDLRRAGVSFRKTAAWKVKTLCSRKPDGPLCRSVLSN